MGEGENLIKAVDPIFRKMHIQNILYKYSYSCCRLLKPTLISEVNSPGSRGRVTDLWKNYFLRLSF